MPKDTMQIAYSVLTENQKKRFELEDELDFSFGIQNLARFPRQLLQAARLHLDGHPPDSRSNIKASKTSSCPKVIADLFRSPRGLVTRHGPTGSGKSTTLGAMIDRINKGSRVISSPSRPDRIHPQAPGRIVNQRRSGRGTRRASGTRSVRLRQDPDVVLVGRICAIWKRSTAGITIAETATMAFATLHTKLGGGSTTASSTSSRRTSNRRCARNWRSGLEGIITQTLLPKRRQGTRDGGGDPRLYAGDPQRSSATTRSPELFDDAVRKESTACRRMNDALYPPVQQPRSRVGEVVRASTDPVELARLCGRDRAFQRAFRKGLDAGARVRMPKSRRASDECRCPQSTDGQFDRIRRRTHHFLPRRTFAAAVTGGTTRRSSSCHAVLLSGLHHE